MAKQEKQGKIDLRREPVQSRARLMKQRILEGARSLLAKDGLAELNTNKLAAEAGIAVGTIYQYFPNKQSILSTLVDEWLTRIRMEVEEFSSEESLALGFDELFSQFLDRIALVERDWGVYLELQRAALLHPEVQALRQAHSEKMSALIAQILKSLGSNWEMERLKKLTYYCIHLNRATFSFAEEKGMPDAEIDQCRVDAILMTLKKAL